MLREWVRSSRAAGEQGLCRQTGIVWSPAGKRELKRSGEVWKLAKTWPCLCSESPARWRRWLHFSSTLPLMPVSTKNNSSTDFPRVISLCRIRLRLDFFWCLTIFRFRYLPCAVSRGCRKKRLSQFLSAVICAPNSVSLLSFCDHTQGGMASGPPRSAFRFGLVFSAKEAQCSKVLIIQGPSCPW